MGEYVDIQKNVILRDIWRDGLTKGRAEGLAKGNAEGALAILSGLLEEKFGPLHLGPPPACGKQLRIKRCFGAAKF